MVKTRFIIQGSIFSLTIWLLIVGCASAPAPETFNTKETVATERAVYVSPDGSDAADGLTRGTAHRTLGKAIFTAKAAGLQKIIVTGKLSAESEAGASPGEGGGVFFIENSGDEEIIISGPAENPAVLSAVGTGKRLMTVAGKSRVRFQNIVLSDGVALDEASERLWGGGILIQEGAIVTLGRGAVLTRNTAVFGAGAAVEPGAGLVMEDGALIVDNTAPAFKYNGASVNSRGGGIFIEDGAAFTFNGGEIRGNSAALGGGVFIHKTPVSMAGGSISGNRGGSGGGLAMEEGAFTLEGGTISGNSAEGGGGVFIVRGEFSMKGGEIKANTASRGGGVYLGVSSCTISGGELGGNSAGSGGGLWMTEGDFLMTDGALIAGNTAKEFGGGVYAGECKTFELAGGAIRANRCGKDGGGLYMRGTDSSLYFIKGGSLEGNRAEVYGGGLASDYSRWVLTDMRICGNTASLCGGGAAFSGGFCAIRGGLVGGNTAGGAGGGIHGREAAALALSGGELSGNSAEEGGGVAVAGAVFEMQAGEISGNTAASGGGFFIAEDGQTAAESRPSLMEGGIIRDNRAQRGAGAALKGGAFRLGGNAIVSANTASVYGGGLYLFPETATAKITLELSGDAAVSGNRAEKSGGGLYMDGGRFTMSGGSVSWNSAGDSGGGVVLAGGRTVRGAAKTEFILSEGSITGNSAPQAGGVYAARGANFSYPFVQRIVVANDPDDIRKE